MELWEINHNFTQFPNNKKILGRRFLKRKFIKKNGQFLICFGLLKNHLRAIKHFVELLFKRYVIFSLVKQMNKDEH